MLCVWCVGEGEVNLKSFICKNVYGGFLCKCYLDLGLGLLNLGVWFVY